MAYYTPSALRAAVSSLSNATTYPDALLADYIATFEDIAERYRGVAYEPRTVAETHEIYVTTYQVTLHMVRVRSVTSVTLDGTTLATTSYKATKAGILRTVHGWIRNASIPFSDLVVTYSHGYDSPPRPILDACREYVRSVAIADRSDVPRDIIQTSIEGMTTRYSTPNMKEGRPTGFLDVDRLLNSMPDERHGFA